MVVVVRNVGFIKNLITDTGGQIIRVSSEAEMTSLVNFDNDARSNDR